VDLLEQKESEILELRRQLSLACSGDQNGLLDAIAEGNAEKAVLKSELDAVREESAGMREALEQLVRLQGDNERASLRQLEELTGTVKSLASGRNGSSSDVEEDRGRKSASPAKCRIIRGTPNAKKLGERDAAYHSEGEARTPRVAVSHKVGRTLVKSDRGVEQALPGRDRILHSLRYDPVR